MIVAIAPNGRIYPGGQDLPFDHRDIVWFLDRLCSRYRKRNVLVIWPGRVHLERLPAYNPELNPVELVWSQLDRSSKNQIFSNLTQLTRAVVTQLEHFHTQPKLIVALFTD